MKSHTEIFRETKSVDAHSNAYPIRQFSVKNSNEEKLTYANVKRIKSCDYAQWDKYDPGLADKVKNEFF